MPEEEVVGKVTNVPLLTASVSLTRGTGIQRNQIGRR